MSKKFDSFEYTFRQSCECCDNKPVLKSTGMCGPCTYGEADSMWDWVEDDYKGEELKQAKRYIRGLLSECQTLGLMFDKYIYKRLQEILKKEDK